MKMAKTVNLTATPGTTEASVVSRLQTAESEGRGQPMNYTRKWLHGCFLLAVLGHGILESLIAMDSAGLMKSMTQEEKATLLRDLIDRTPWQEPRQSPVVPEPVRTATEPETPVVPEQGEVLIKKSEPEEKPKKPDHGLNFHIA